MDDQEIISRLEAIRQQSYPLTLSSDDADALVECIRRVMSEVPDDYRVFVRADYDLATSALCHPEPSENCGNSNVQRQ